MFNPFSILGKGADIIKNGLSCVPKLFIVLVGNMVMVKPENLECPECDNGNFFDGDWRVVAVDEDRNEFGDGEYEEWLEETGKVSAEAKFECKNCGNVFYEGDV